MTMPVLFLKAHPARPSQPTEAQKEAGNYAKERMSFQGLPISIENPRGSIRSGRDRGGNEWSVSMAHHYGYIRGTLGSDGDHYDVYVGPNAEAEHAYIVTTMAPPTFTEADEQKAMLGFNSEEDARAAYLAHYDDPRFFGGIVTMPMAEFKAKVMATAEGDGLVKALVHAHERRAGRGRVIFVKPYSTRAPAADQADLFSYVPPVAPSPKGMTIAGDDVSRTIPGGLAAAETMRQRLMPGHVIHLRVVDQAKGPAGYITSPHRDIVYGQDNTVLPAGKPEPDLVVHINRSDFNGDVRRPEELVHTLLHEYGHAFQFTRFHQAPEDVKRAIEAQWQAETHGLPARSMDEAPPRRSVLGRYDAADAGSMRRWISMGIPEKYLGTGPDANREANLRERSPYFRVFEEWFAEKFAVWMTHQAAESPIDRFFDAARRQLAAAWRRALDLLGMKTAQHGSAIERFMDDAWREGAPMMGKAILFLKAAIRGGAMGDLFAEKVTVQGHTQGSTYVAPYQATRHKAPEVSPEHADIATAIGAWHLTRQRAPKGETHTDRLEAWRKKVHPRMALSDEQRQKIVEAMDARRTRLNAKVRAIIEKEKALAEPPPEPRTNGETREHMLAADDDTYLRTLADLAHRRLASGGTFQISTYTRTTRYSHPDHKASLEYRDGQIMVRQGSKWVALGKVGQAIDSLASSLGVPTTYDRLTYAAEKASAADPLKQRAKMEAHATALAPHFDAHDKARDAWSVSGSVDDERAMDAAQRAVQDEGAKRGLDRYGVGEARDIHDARPKPKPGIPPDVARRISDMVVKLHEHHKDLTAARKLDGGLADPHYEREWRAGTGGRGGHAQAMLDKIEVFRDLAENKGLAAEADRIIQDAGGIPDMKATGPIAWTAPPAKAAPAAPTDPAMIRARELQAEYEANVERLSNNQQARNGFMAKLRAAAAKTPEDSPAATVIDVVATRAGLEWQHKPLTFAQPGTVPKKVVLMPKPDLVKTEARHRRDIEKLTTGMLPPPGSPEDGARLQKVAKLTAKHGEAKAALDAARAAAPPPKATMIIGGRR